MKGPTTFPLLRATMNYTVNAHHMYTHVWDTVSTGADIGTGTGSGASAAGGGAEAVAPLSAPSPSAGGGGSGSGGGSGKGFLTIDSPGKSSGSSPGACKSPVSPGKDDRRQTLSVTAVSPFLQRDNCIISIVEEKSTGTVGGYTSNLNLKAISACLVHSSCFGRGDILVLSSLLLVLIFIFRAESRVQSILITHHQPLVLSFTLLFFLSLFFLFSISYLHLILWRGASPLSVYYTQNRSSSLIMIL